MFGFSLSCDRARQYRAHHPSGARAAFLLSALATLLNVFSTRLGRISDKVDSLAAEAARASGIRRRRAWFRRLTFLRRRSFVLDIAVVLASLAGGRSAWPC